MRRSPTAAILVGFLAVALVGLGTAGGRAGQEAATPAAGTPTIDLLGITEYLEATPFPQFVALNRVSLLPGTAAPQHIHRAPSVLSVLSGAVCFELHNPPEDRVSVGVTTKSAGAAGSTDVNATPAPGTCQPEGLTCESAGGCTLESPGRVLLTAGDSITQSLHVEHSYRNVGPDQAVVLISELQTDDPIAPCGGRCY